MNSNNNRIYLFYGEDALDNSMILLSDLERRIEYLELKEAELHIIVNIDSIGVQLIIN